MARMAADSTTRIAEDLLASRTMSYGQLHLYDHTTLRRCLRHGLI
jgi:hypothetical protein